MFYSYKSQSLRCILTVCCSRPSLICCGNVYSNKGSFKYHIATKHVSKFIYILHQGLFALREILFVLQKNLPTRNHFKCERFFSSTKILSSVTKLQRDRRVALEAYNFLSSEKIYCSVTATLQRVIIFRNRYHTKWYCVRDPIYRHLKMDR